MPKLRHAPVYFAIIQARFNPIAALDAYVAKIQDELRRNGFPDFQKGLLTTFSLAAVDQGQGGAPPQVPVSQTARYSFLNVDKTEGFLLDQGALSFQTTDYDVFETFSETFLTGLRMVHEAVGLSYTDRIGVRYLDAVYPKEGEDLREYLTESVLGLYGRFKGTLVHSFSETRFGQGNTSVIARTFIQDGQVGFPPDLQPAVLTIGPRFQGIKGQHAILDTDGAREHRSAFDLDHVREILSAVHGTISAVFKETVTDHAIKVWD